MKRLFHLLFFLSLSVTAQNAPKSNMAREDFNNKQFSFDTLGNRLYTFPTIRGERKAIDLTLDEDKPVSTLQRLALNKKTEITSLSALRSQKVTAVAVQLYDRPGVYFLDSSDLKTPDNGGTVIVNVSGKRYKSNQRVITPALFGAFADGRADDRLSLQSAIQYAANNSLPFEWESGVYNISGPISIILSKHSGSMNRGGKRLSIKGAGIASTVVRYTGKAAVDLIEIIGTTDDYLSIDGMRIVTTQSNHTVRNSTGLKISKLANFHIANIAISFFDLGLNLTNAGEGLITNLTVEWNRRGLYAGQYGPPGTAIAPNAIHFNSCAFNSNLLYGAFIENGCNNTFTACRFLANGTDDKSHALKISYTGQNGGVSASVIGNYFEGTKGTDIEVITSAGGAHYFAGNTFNKFDNNRFANTHIKFTPLNLVANDKKTNVISMKANAMWSTDKYTPSKTRPTIICDYGPNGYNGWIVDDNNYYQNISESPVYTGSSQPKYEVYEPSRYRISSATAKSGVLDLSNSLGTYIFLTNADGTRISKIVAESVGKLIILQADSKITLDHNATLMLKNNAPFTFSPGQTITLFCQSPNVFREIARQ